MASRNKGQGKDADATHKSRGRKEECPQSPEDMPVDGATERHPAAVAYEPAVDDVRVATLDVVVQERLLRGREERHCLGREERQWKTHAKGSTCTPARFA